MKNVCRALLLCALTATGAFAQDTTGIVEGVVSDPSGAVVVGAQVTARNLDTGHAGLLSPGNRIVVKAESAARLLLLAGRPLGEPIVQYGPFVMNTSEEIEQAIRDYQSGALAPAAAASS